MRLTVIGCSGSLPGPDSPASCYLVEAEGFRLLLDLGNGAIGPLQRHVPLDAVDAVFLSHLHADHCLDICPYHVARTYSPGGLMPPLPVYAPEGAAERLSRAYGMTEERALTDAFTFSDTAPGRWLIGPFEVALARVNHPVETYAIRLEHAGRSLVYSADTGESDELVALARGADLLLCEASFVEGPDLPPNLHLTARQAADHALRAGAGRLMLTHLAPWNDRNRTQEEASAAAFEGPISMASSGDSFDLG